MILASYPNYGMGLQLTQRALREEAGQFLVFKDHILPKKGKFLKGIHITIIEHIIYHYNNFSKFELLVILIASV